MLPELMKSLGDFASIPLSNELDDVHAKIDSSSEYLMISYSSLRNARSPSPYRSGILTLERPKRQYAISSFLLVFLLETQLIFLAAHAGYCKSRCSWSRYFCSIPVILEISSLRFIEIGRNSCSLLVCEEGPLNPM